MNADEKSEEEREKRIIRTDRHRKKPKPIHFWDIKALRSMLTKKKKKKKKYQVESIAFFKFPHAISKNKSIYYRIVCDLK